MAHSRKPDEPARPAASSLKIAYAIARQRVHDLHFQGLTELIERARGEVAAPQAVAIYLRVHDLGELDAQALKNRVMVHMGRAAEADIKHLPNTFVAVDGAVEWDVSASLVERIRKRVGGRRRHALREWIELHGGHMEAQLQRLHVECLRDVREAAGAGVRLRDLVASYGRELGVRDSLVDALYFAFAERLFEEVAAEDRTAPTEEPEAKASEADLDASPQTDPGPARNLKLRHA